MNSNTNIEELRKAIRDDFHSLLVKEFTADWKIQRMVHDCEIDIMDFDNVNKFIQQKVIEAYNSINFAIDQGFIEPYTPEPKHWRAEKYTTYYYVCTMLDTIEARADQQLEFDNSKYNSGNYFKSQATAELAAKAQKLFFEWLHDKEAGYCIEDNFADAMDEAKRAVLEDDSNE